MMDEDYAFETQRQKRLDEESPELEALRKLRNEVVKMSFINDELEHRYGFLCIAIIRISTLPHHQYVFLREKVKGMLNGRHVMDIEMDGDLHTNYVYDDAMFAAMNHAYRLGIVDQWIKEMLDVLQ